MAETNGGPRLGIALGGGGGRGYAHIGVLAALAEAGIEPAVVCGTSIGALVGGIYAAGKLAELEAWAATLTRRRLLRLVDLNVGSGGPIRGRKLLELYREHLGDITIEALPRPFAAVATDLVTGGELWLTRGSLLTAIRASISVPGVFAPVLRDGRWLADGGLVNPVPVTPCRALGADVVLAVDLNSEPTTPQDAGISNKPGAPTPSFASVLTAAVDIMQFRISRSRLAADPSDVLVAPRVSHVPMVELTGGAPTIREGARAMRRAVPALKRLLQSDT